MLCGLLLRSSLLLLGQSGNHGLLRRLLLLHMLYHGHYCGHGVRLRGGCGLLLSLLLLGRVLGGGGGLLFLIQLIHLLVVVVVSVDDAGCLAGFLLGRGVARLFLLLW